MNAIVVIILFTVSVLVIAALVAWVDKLIERR